MKLKDIETNKIYNEIKDLDPGKFKYKNYKRRFYLRMLFLRLYSFYGLENAIKIMMKKITNPETFSKFIKYLNDFSFSKDYFKSKINEFGSKQYYVASLYGKLNKCLWCGKYCLRDLCSCRCVGFYNASRKTTDDYNNIHIKMNQTMIKKYGSIENAKKISNEKCKKTQFKKYGCFFSQTEKGRELSGSSALKGKETHFKKYGCWYSQTEEGRKKISIASKEAAKKTRLHWLKKYGVNYASQRKFLNINDLNKEFIESHFVENGCLDKEAVKKYYNFSDSHFSTIKKKFNIQIPNKINKLKAQRELFDLINVKNKIRDDKSLIYPKEIDILLPDFKLGIEYDGLLFHSQGKSKHSIFNTPDFDKNYHLNKTELCESKGFQLFHIFESENIDLWLSMINNKLGLNKKIYARKCVIKEIDTKECSYFLNENHLQGNIPAPTRIGLYYESELVQVMTFGKSRFNKKYDFELLRLCSKKFVNVVGGASKLFNYFLIKYNPKSIISYANRRFSQGKIYEVLGFKKIGITKPNYFYFKSRNALKNMKEAKLYSRIKFQKHKLKNILTNFDSKLSESENMFNNGYRRIFDCGNLVYEFRKDF